MPQPLYPRERPGTHCIGGWVGPRAVLDSWGKYGPRQDSNPGPSTSPQWVAIPTALSQSTWESVYAQKIECCDLIPTFSRFHPAMNSGNKGLIKDESHERMKQVHMIHQHFLRSTYQSKGYASRCNITDNLCYHDSCLFLLKTVFFSHLIPSCCRFLSPRYSIIMFCLSICTFVENDM